MSLSRFHSESINRVLKEEAARISQAADEPCGVLGHAITPLSALVVLAERHLADLVAVKAAAGRTWQCPTNRAASQVAAALAKNELPRNDDLTSADLTAAVMTLHRLKRTPTRDAIDLAFLGLIDSRWGVVRGQVEDWLKSLGKVEEPDAGTMTGGDHEATYHAKLRAWWDAARPTWRVHRQ